MERQKETVKVEVPVPNVDMPSPDKGDKVNFLGDTVDQEKPICQPPEPTVLGLTAVDFYYGHKHAVANVTMNFPVNKVTALIGPSGCGKSTLLRCLNRMNDVIPGSRVGGRIEYNGQDIYANEVDPVEVRRRIGMVFQKPNPFSKVDLRQLRLWTSGQWL